MQSYLVMQRNKLFRPSKHQQSGYMQIGGATRFLGRAVCFGFHCSRVSGGDSSVNLLLRDFAKDGLEEGEGRAIIPSLMVWMKGSGYGAQHASTEVVY